MFPENLQTTSGLSILLRGIISLPDAMSYDKNIYKISEKRTKHGKTAVQILMKFSHFFCPQLQKFV